MRLSDQPKRACIYFIYDRDGIVDRYVVQQLEDMRKNVAFLHCVINGKLTAEGKKTLERVADQVYVRENKGNDIGAYKAAIQYIGWEKLSSFDELVIMNNTCFGPVYPFRECFDWAKDQDIDFWGLTGDTKTDWLGTKNYLHYNESRVHMQSYFLVLRRPLLGSSLLKEFFDEIPEDASYVFSGCYYEYAFPGYFEERGYRGALYCGDEDDMDYPLLHNPVSLLRKYRMPLFKKRSFFHHYTDVLNHSAGEATARLIRFLQEETDYDMDLVWESILRTCSLSDVVRCAQLNRVLPSRQLTDGKPAGGSRVGLVYHAYYEDLFDESISYIMNFPALAGVLITTDTQEKKVALEAKLQAAGGKGEVIVIENRGRDVSSLLVGAAEFVKRYDLICFAHEKKTPQIKPYTVGRSWAYKLHENMFGTGEFVQNVIAMFEREKRLGIAFPSAPNHSHYAYSIGNGWSGNFENTRKLLTDFHVRAAINEHTLCVAPLGTCFWFRTKALEKLFAGYDGDGWKYSDFPREPNRYDQTILHAIERSYAYFAQDAGYYPVYLYSDRFAQVELTTLEFNQSGATEMRAWVNALAMNSLVTNSQKRDEEMTAEEIVQRYEQSINYGVKQSMIHLAFALRCKYPTMWKIMLPVRRVVQMVLGIKTK